MKIIISIALFLAIVFSFRNIFDPKIYQFSALEIDRNLTRREYIGGGLKKVYKNRLGVVIFNDIYPRVMKFETIFFSDMSNTVLYIPLFGFLLYLGNKKYQ